MLIPGAPPSSMPLLSIKNLSIRFGGIVALDDVSLDIKLAQIMGLIGPNGAGKTTIFNCITRIYHPDSGSITIDGRDLLRMQPHEVIGAGVARTFQNLELFNSMSVLDNVLVGLHSTMKATAIEAAFVLPRSRSEERLAKARAQAVLELLHLGRYAGVPAGGLPFGVKKRVEMARALAGHPKLLLLDEPANGLNREEVDELGGIIRALRNDLNVTVLLVEHHMGLVMAISDRVCVLDFGRRIAEGTPVEIQNDSRVIAAYLGEPVA